MLHPNAEKKVLNIFNLSPVKGNFGVELEVEGDNLPEHVEGWVTKPETSLRGTAYEYVIDGAANIAQLKQLMHAFNVRCGRAKAVIKPSERCSTHIHLNMQDVSIRTYFGFVILWSMLEPLILRLCGDNRNGNLFCMTSYECSGLPIILQKQVTTLMGGKYFADRWFSRGKYSSLNIDTLRHLGTVEARCFPLSTDTDTVLKWAGWMKSILDTVETWPDDTYQTLVDQVYNNPDHFFRTIFPGEPVFAVSNPHNPRELAQAGCEIGYELMKAVRPVLLWDKAASKKEKQVRAKKSVGLWTVNPFDDDPAMVAPTAFSIPDLPEISEAVELE